MDVQISADCSDGNDTIHLFGFSAVHGRLLDMCCITTSMGFARYTGCDASPTHWAGSQVDRTDIHRFTGHSYGSVFLRRTSKSPLTLCNSGGARRATPSTCGSASAFHPRELRARAFFHPPPARAVHGGGVSGHVGGLRAVQEVHGVQHARTAGEGGAEGARSLVGVCGGEGLFDGVGVVRRGAGGGVHALIEATTTTIAHTTASTTCDARSGSIR